jgi:mannose-6-phosphate isomerase-like protein (cupin superfamily)
MKLIDNLEKYEDDRGLIQNFVPDGVIIKSALYITGKKGAVRGNHVHTKDEHYCVVVEGKIRYEYKENEGAQTKSVLLTKGMAVHTPAGERHRFIFMIQGAFVALATEPRKQDHYEADTKREVF